ncbi:MAG: ABC transporter [Acidiferrobacter sp.]|nr:ABC transporter [Acidiferrobacter sp.]
MNDKPLLQLKGIGKTFPGCIANDDIDLEIAPGEIHALLGENGAGKSTLVKIIYGVLRPDQGTLCWRGDEMIIDNPASARSLGIGMVFQHFSLFESMTTLENVALALPPQDLDELRGRLETTAQDYGLTLHPDRHVYDLSMGERQRIEIVRCLLQNPSLLILDEPTSVLTPQETEVLFATLRQLASEGRSILYISHKLEEVRSLCDRATILRGGKRVDDCNPAEETAQSLAEKMIGRRVESAKGHSAAATSEVRLNVTDLSVRSDEPHGTDISDISFSVHAGEILGIAGIAGNGQTELMNALSGETGAPQAGTIEILETDASRLGPMARRQLGAVFVPEERVGQAAVSDLTLVQNSFLTSAFRMGFVSRGIIDWPGVGQYTEEILDKFDVKATGTDALASSLSGGNLQKFIVGREILQGPQLLVVSQPTWGVDAGAAAAIHEKIQQMISAGAGALVISQDLDEIFALSDRIAVISQGRLSAPRPTGEVTTEEVGLLMGASRPGSDTDSHVHA